MDPVSGAAPAGGGIAAADSADVVPTDTSDAVPAIITLTATGAELAARIAALLPAAEIHARRGRGAAGAAGVYFDDAVIQLRQLFLQRRPLIGVCAAGVLIRALAPLLADKNAEPPVLAVAEDGSAVLPLLGGHRGANRLATTLATGLGGVAALTTAGARRFGVALETPPPGWTLVNPQDYKTFAAALLAGAPLRLDIDPVNAALDHGWLAGLPFDASAAGADDSRAGALTIAVSDRAERSARAAAAAGPRRLLYRPATLALGVGCERGADPAALAALVDATLAEHGLAAGALAAVCSLDLKADEAAVLALGKRLGVPCRFYSADQLEAQTPRLASPSDVVFRAVGCHGVAEAAALAAAGPDAALVVAKTRSARATCAVARAPQPIEPERCGRARGRLFVVGIGPGDPRWRTAAADAALLAADELVGYSLYLDLLGPLATGKTRHDYPLGAETERTRRALDLAAEGRSVALVCSGDPGIYAMAALVFEQLDRAPRPGWRRCDIEVVPGVSALQAAAARGGALLGHDFCAISLSDLLTPWHVIERRVRAAADGDFVVAFYNPVSRRRRDQLTRAATLLREQRPADTPVLLGRNLGRADETLSRLTLGELDADRVDMLTLVLVGSSASRRAGDWLYTPRGYAAKRTAAGSR